MISGVVTSDLVATLQVVVLGANGQQQEVSAILDTGFSGFLTLPPAVIASLELVWLGRQQGVLADGRMELFDVYRGALIWDGQSRPVEIEAANAEPLVGMALLHGHEVRVRVFDGGSVTIAILS